MIKRPTIGIDVDDTLMPFNEIAVQMANERLNPEPLFSIDEIDQWDPKGRIRAIQNLYQDPELLRRQKPYPGAQEFVQNLYRIADVYFVTAVSKTLVGERCVQLKNFFPDVKEDHYIFTSQKEALNLDFILDDGGHNILDSAATYPVLMRRPWNQHISGMLSVEDYEGFLFLMEQVKRSFMAENIRTDIPTVFALVGPSGSGKKMIIQNLVDTEPFKFQRPVTYTTRKPRYDDLGGIYHYQLRKEFRKKKEQDFFFETSIYAGEQYGSSYDSIASILKTGAHAVLAADISGAMAIKAKFPTVICYVKQKREKMLQDIISRKCSDQDKVNRILSIENEIRNEMVCDVTLDNRTENTAVQKILEIAGRNVKGRIE